MVAGIPFSGLVFKILLGGGVVAGAAILADKANLGTAFSQGANELGKAGGNALTQPIAGLVESLSLGVTKISEDTRKLWESFGSAGADVQGAFTGNRDAIKDFFDGNNERPTQRPSVEKTYSKRLSDKGIATSIQRAISANSSKGSTNSRGTSRDTSVKGFGGFGSAISQETSLQKLLRQNMEKYPEWFK